MPKTVSTSEAKERLGALIAWAVEHGDAVIVEKHGAPNVAIVPFAEYETLQARTEVQRRRDALAALRQLREEVGARNRDLTEEQAEALADRFVRDVLDDMVAEGKIRFAR